MPENNRLYAYDIVRVVAMTFVVAVHSLVALDTSSHPMFLLFAACQVVFFTANALFFMLSGKFNLRERKDDAGLRQYYLKRFRGFMIPIIILFLIRTIYNLYPHFGSIANIGKEYVKNSLGAFSSMEYWFVFTLFGFLIVAPFIAPIFSRMTAFSKKVFLGIGLGYNLLTIIAQNLGLDFSWGYLFSGFALAFFLGAFIEGLFTSPKSRKILYVASIASVVITVWMHQEGLTQGIHDISPFYTILAIGIYIFLLNAFKSAKPSRVVSFIAEHSFSVYLVHMMFLLPIQSILPPLTGIATIPLYLAVVAAVLALSLLCAIVIDALLIKPTQKLFDRVTGMIRNRGKKES